MTYVNYQKAADYFKLLATKYITIAHTTDAPRFFPSWDEALEKKAKLQNLAGKYIMIVDELDIRGSGANSDNNQRQRSISVFVLKMMGKKDFPLIDAAYDECEKIHDQVIARIKYDQEECTTDNICNLFDPNNYSGDRVGPLFDNWYGYAFEYRLQSNVNLEYDATKWL